MGNHKKLTQIRWSRETTLDSLWRSWMDLNELSTERDAIGVLASYGIQGADNISLWLQNKTTRGLLSTMMQKTIDATGIDLDGWLVCEAKRLVLNERPELESLINFDKMTSRKEVVSELKTWADLYAGNHYLALQMRIPPGQISHYMQGTHFPGMDFLPTIIRHLAQGFIGIDCQEDIIFIMMCRAILGCDPQDFFPGVTSFKSAVDELLRPYKGYRSKKIAEATGIHYAVIDSLQSWKPVLGKRGMGPESVEKILRALFVRKYPHLENTFEEARLVYRKDEVKGIWEVPTPLKSLIEIPRADPIATKKAETRTTKPSPPKKTEKSPVVVEEEVVKHVQVVPEATPIAPSDYISRSEIASLLTEFASRVHPPTKPIPASIQAREIGSTIEGVHHCLDEATWKRQKNKKISTQEIERVRLAIERLRAVLVELSELDPDYIRTELSPIFGPELFELFMANEGMKHILGTHGAWGVVAATRETAQIMRNKGG